MGKVSYVDDRRNPRNDEAEIKRNLKRANRMESQLSPQIEGDDMGEESLESPEDEDSEGYSKCPLAKRCGGCQLQGMSYNQQLRKKQAFVEELLGKYGAVKPILGMKDPYHYRNKVHAVFDRQKNGTIVSGVYEEGTHQVVPVEFCQIENQKADAIINDIRGMIKSFKIKTYDEDTGYGLLRHVLVRSGYHSGEIMVVLVLGSPILPSKNNFIKALRNLHPEITTIVVNVNDRQTSMILGDKEKTIYGSGYIEDTLCGLTFRISPKSFYQINTLQTEVLYSKAIEFAGLTGTERVIDAYCGIGTIGLIASKYAGEVIGVESNRDAAKDASVNKKRNNITNARFMNDDAGNFMVQMVELGEKADVVFMDPPRSGSDEAFLSSLIKLAPEKIVYISCSPITLARDLQILMDSKVYKIMEIQPVDMFPFSNHVENVVLLKHI